MDIDQKILKRVLEKGWLQLDALIEKGLLEEEAIAQMLNEIVKEEQKDLTQTDPEKPIRDETPKEIGVFGQYLNLELLGKGGMAEVFRAYDPELNRLVALKFLLAPDPSLRQRLLREARSQAKIDHPNICKVFEVGELNSRPYIAMQYIAGSTLKELSEELSIEQKILLMRSLADALHEAHRLGIIHRDIKPSNVMVERREDGEIIPHLVDFGLAHQIEDSATTATNVIVGTPWYMSPEQAMGNVHTLDRRSDVYSLGVMLYELLSNELPYGENALASRTVIDQDPISLRKRNKSIPVDLETIVMKCLEREVFRRYDSAKDFGDDLQRYLDGEPILAKRANWAHRLVKKAKKNKVAAAILSIALLLTLFLTGMLLWVRWVAQKEKQYSNEFSQEVRFIESMMGSVYMSPLHDIRSELEKARSRLGKIEKRTLEEGKLSYAPAQNALGQGYLVLRDFEKARQELEKAWQAGYRQSDTAYALGRVLSSQYHQALTETDRISNKETREQKRLEVDRLYRDKAVWYLKMSQGYFDSHALIEGLIALYEKRYEIALNKAKVAHQDALWSYEAKKLEADVYMEMGRGAYDKGDFPSASENFKAAGKAYQTAVQFGRSDQSLYLADCDRLLKIMRLENDQGLSPDYSLKEIITRADQAILINQDNSEPYRKKALAYLYLSIFQILNSNDDLRPALKESIRYSQEAIKRNSKNGDAYRELATGYVLFGEYEFVIGIDPMKSLSQALRKLEIAIQLNPNDDEAYKTSGNVYSIIAQYQAQNGRNPETSLQESIQQFQKALKKNQNNSGVLNNLGITYIDKAANESNHGTDPTDSLEKAIGSLHQALKIQPRNHMSLNNLCFAHLSVGLWEISQGKDPRSRAEQSIKECDKSLKINSTQSSPLYTTASAYILISEFELRTEGDPRLMLNRAKELAQECLQKNHNNPHVYRALADIYRLLSLHDLHQNRDPSPNLKLARTNAEKAISMNPTDFYFPQIRGLIETVATRWSLRNNQTPTNFIKTAKPSFQKAIDLNPNSAENYQGLAECYRWESEWNQLRKIRSDETIKRGLDVIEKALAINSRHAESIATKGTFFLMMAQNERDLKKQAELAEQACVLLEDSLKINSFLKREYESAFKQAERLSNRSQIRN